MSLAKDKLDGFSCFWCGVYFEKEHGYPVLCNDCWKRALLSYRNRKNINDHGIQKAIYTEL